MEILTAILAALSGLSPIAALGWLVAISLAIYVGKDLRGESLTEKELRDKIEDLHRTHLEAIKAGHESRVSDLLSLNERYEVLLKEILSALKKASK